MGQFPQKIQDIDPSTYGMPFEEGIAASTIRAALGTLPQEDARELISEIVSPKFTALFPVDRNKLRPSPDVAVHIKKDKLALLLDSISDFSAFFLREGLENHDIEDKNVGNALNTVLDALNGIGGKSIAENCSSEFARFLLDCYMTLV